MKIEVTYSCGHTGTIDVFGGKKERERREWIASKNFCPECEAKEREAYTADCASKARELGLPELHGSEKQIAWALTLRAEFIANFAMALEDTQWRLGFHDADFDPNTLNDEEQEVYKQMLRDMDTYTYVMKTKADARFWIDARDKSAYSVLRRVYDVELKDIAPGTTVDEAEEEKKAATIAPEKVTHDSAVTVIVKDARIELHYLKDSTFRTIVKSHGFRWNVDDKVWYRRMTETTGTVEDRAAEIANLLLRRGFAVTLYDEQLRQKAISADFTPEHRLWVTLSKDRVHFRLQFPTEEREYLAQACAIKGAADFNDVVVVPKERWREVVDFAACYGFRITDAAQQLIDALRDPGATIVTPAAPNVAPRIDKLSEMLTTDDGVLDDLRDDDA